MDGKIWLALCLIVVSPLAATAQSSAAKPQRQSKETRTGRRAAVVPEQVAVLVRPILDEQQELLSRQKHGEHRLSKLLYDLTHKNGRIADEALVVLMCFNVGESQEETDAVIARGRKMLPHLTKYRDRNPAIPKRTYGDSMLKGISNKAEAFDGAIKAISRGWHSTGDNPEGM